MAPSVVGARSAPWAILTTTGAALRRHLALTGALLCGVLSSAALATPLEQPEAIARFAEKMRALDAGEPQRVRITHFGDSHIAADLITGPIREAWQARYGDGGRGFLLAGRPWSSYRQQQMNSRSEGSWRTDGLRGGMQDGWYGPAGCSSATRQPGASLHFQIPPSPPGAEAVVHFLRQPHGGCLQMKSGERTLATLSSAGPWLEASSYRQPLPAGSQSLSVSAHSPGELRVFGLSIEAPVGLIYDALGINGAHATRLLQGDAEGFSESLRALRPDLVILSYGTNEIYAGALNLDRQRRLLDRVLAQVRAAHPAADCLLTGPPDFLRRQRAAPEIVYFTQMQRERAQAHGCAFWDAQAAMGGPGAVRQWRRRGWAQKDMVHLSREGYQRLGAALQAAIEEALLPPLPFAPLPAPP